MSRYDHNNIAEWRREGQDWPTIAERLGVNPETLRGVHSRWRRRQAVPALSPDAVGQERSGASDAETFDGTVSRMVDEAQLRRIQSVEDLIDLFGVDTERFSIEGVKINTWEQHSVDRGLVTLCQATARFIPKQDEIDLAQILEDFKRDAAEHAPHYLPIPRRLSLGQGDPTLFELVINDPHIGMLAWGEETGESYDSKIAVADYGRAVEQLLTYAQFYPTERILYLVGNDTLHVDGPAPTAKGNNRGGATTGGTAQDVDSRRAKVFTLARRALVAGVDRAREVAPVDVLVVPGNHDENEMFRMGEVLSAWYRNDPEVRVLYGPAKRSYYGWGKNAFLFTHGEEYARQRDSLPLIMATECPPEIWLASAEGSREIHTGHNHIAKAGRYTPTSDLTESRAIRTRSLPGLTAGDAWHVGEGYKHRRTATALVWRQSGGLAGLHEFNP